MALGRLACADQSFPLLPHAVAVRLIGMLKFEAVDLALVGGQSHVRPEHLIADAAGATRTVRQLLDDAQLSVSDVFLIADSDIKMFATNSPDREQRLRAREIFEVGARFARAVDADGITVLPGLEWPDERPGVSLRCAAEELSWRVERASTLGLRVSIEPHLGSLACAPERACELLAVTRGLQLTLDLSHFIYQGYGQRELEPLLADARHVHARGAHVGCLQAPNHEDAIDVERLVMAMDEHGFDGTIALEYLWLEWEACNRCDTLSETVLLRDRLRAALARRASTLN